MRTPTTVDLYLQNPLPDFFPNPKLVSSNSKPNFLNFRSENGNRGFSGQFTAKLAGIGPRPKRFSDKLVYFSTNSSEQHGASGSAKCVIKQATGGGAFKYADLFKEKLGISLDKADEMDCLLGGGYHFGLPFGFVVDSIGATLGAGTAFLLGRTGTAADQIQVIEMIKLLETKGSKIF
ncbi:pantothenate kinase 2-like [Pyrus ussuriensis x Pyrus communis]|uniref:Pantothenate kinase 2-like n=1 Tax=Pyrus ussuriensis x Pyrus communis TaxID=2448454 RepID=A0A5N5FJ17_9ROSA|nr:pantothenate kinase 2-like [Pyrus ussuriensis x Pyrus communis]